MITSIGLAALFIALAAACNAVMDKTTHHFGSSIFKNLNPHIWNANVAWRGKYVNGDPTQGRVTISILGFTFNKPVQFVDAWHFFKMWMVFFLCLAVVSITGLTTTDWAWYNHYMLWVGLGMTWNVSFVSLYVYIFKSKG